jgi:hypothetical protein
LIIAVRLKLGVEVVVKVSHDMPLVLENIALRTLPMSSTAIVVVQAAIATTIASIVGAVFDMGIPFLVPVITISSSTVMDVAQHDGSTSWTHTS